MTVTERCKLQQQTTQSITQAAKQVSIKLYLQIVPANCNSWQNSKGKGSPYSITERRVPELIPVLGSQQVM